MTVTHLAAARRGTDPADAVTAAHRAHTRALAAAVVALVPVVRGDAYRAEGHPTAVSWLMARLAISFRSARDLVEAAQGLEALPHLTGAFAEGSITFDQLRALVRVATPTDDETLAATAPSWSFAQTEAHVREEEVRRADACRRRAAEAALRRRQVEADRGQPPAGPAPAAGHSPSAGPATGLFAGAGQDSAEESTTSAADEGVRGIPGAADLPGAALPGWLRLRPGRGGGHLEGFLPDERFAALKARLEAVADGIGPDPVTRCRPRWSQRMAEALSQVVEAGPGAPGERPLPEIVVHADVGLLDASADGEAVATVDGAGPLAAEVLRRLACEARIRLAAELDGVTVDLGRRRRVPSRALAAEVARRDRTCRFPGCTLGAHLQIHHLVPWAEGGATDLANLALHCYRDHLRLHHGGWTVEGDANSELRYTSPEGRVLTSVPAPGWTGGRRRRRTDRPRL